MYLNAIGAWIMPGSLWRSSAAQKMKGIQIKFKSNWIKPNKTSSTFYYFWSNCNHLIKSKNQIINHKCNIDKFNYFLHIHLPLHKSKKPLSPSNCLPLFFFNLESNYTENKKNSCWVGFNILFFVVWVVYFGLYSCNKAQFCGRIVPGSVACWMQSVVGDERDVGSIFLKRPQPEPRQSNHKPNQIMTREVTNIDQYVRPICKTGLWSNVGHILQKSWHQWGVSVPFDFVQNSSEPNTVDPRAESGKLSRKGQTWLG